MDISEQDRKPFIRIKESPQQVADLLRGMRISASIERVKKGDLAGTVKVYIDEGSNVPRLIRSLGRTHAKRGPSWEPKGDRSDEGQAQMGITRFPVRKAGGEGGRHYGQRQAELRGAQAQESGAQRERTAISTTRTPRYGPMSGKQMGDRVRREQEEEWSEGAHDRQ